VVHKTFTQGIVDPSSYRITTHGFYQRHISDAQPAEKASYDFDHKTQAHADTFAAWYLWPSASIQVYPGNIVSTFFWQPLSAGRTRLISEWFFSNRPMTETQEEFVRQHWATTFMEDFILVESVQRGLASRGYERAPQMIDRNPSEMSEHGLLAFQVLVRDALGNV
jgi:choline monooxygenase